MKLFSLLTLLVIMTSETQAAKKKNKVDVDLRQSKSTQK